MVAVVSGTGLGLFNSSTSTLGGAGANGNSNVGRGRDQVFVNTTTGNLIVQSVDDTLAALGLDLAAVRTYNSQGLTDEDNSDQWRLGVHERVYNLVGTVNTANSKITKVFGDGAEVVYTWNTTRSRYESSDGDGANDFMTWNGTSSTWTWTDGSARNTEEYGLVGGVQRIKFSRDADGNTVTYTYTGSLLTSIAMAGATAQTVFFDYTDSGAAANNLRAVRVVSNGVTQTLTRYTYDASQRLQTVTVDLTPGDNSVADNVTYTTTYAYDGTSKRIQSITQKDGSSVAFTYQNVNGDYRLKTVTDAESRVTTFTYNDVLAGGGTPASIPAVAGQYSTQDTIPYTMVNGVLTAPAAGWEGATLREGLTASSNDPRIVYDSAGNGLLIWRSGSDLLAQRYTRATNSWSAEVTLEARTSTTYAPSLSIDRATGNAIAAWAQSDGTAISIYSARYNATTNTWSTAQLVDVAPADATFPVNNASDSLVTAINGTRATVAWHHNQTASGTVYDLYVARFDGTNWLAPQLVEASANNAAQASIALDNQGNISVAFQQSDGTIESLYVNRFTLSAGTWSGASLRESSATAINNPRIEFDANGNGLLIYRTGSDIRAQRYTRSTNSWAATEVTLDTRTGTAYVPVLAMDYASGNAMAVWVQSDGTANSVYAARYDVATNTWGAAAMIDGAPAPAAFAANATLSALAASMNGNRAIVTWQHNQAASGSVYDVYAARFDGTNWIAPVLMESSVDNGASVGAAIDSSGNALVSFRQMSGGVESIFVNRFNIAAPPAYYEVTAGATWQSVAAAVYNINSVAAGTELQARLAPQTLATGVRLVNFPPTLSVVSTVAPYYVVVSGDTWPIITQKVYGTTDANVIAGLQAFSGLSTVPPVGQRINIQNPLQYTIGGTGASIYQRTTVQDALGLITTYLKDAQGRLISVQTPAVGGASIETRYTYDPVTGNVATITQDPTGLNRVTTFTYDAVTGLLRFSRDSLGNTVERTYNANNQLESEISYLVRDPDGGGNGVATVPLTSRFVYDAENHLRFAISADGRVTEHVYNTNGERTTTYQYAVNAYSGAYTESALNSWATLAAQRGGALERLDYAYDFRSNISTITAWAATTSTGAGTGTASVTRFVYDQRGMLLSTVEARGEATSTPTNDYLTSYTYDGLGRLLTTSAWVSSTETARLVQTNSYDDTGRRVVSTFANGLVKTSSYNRDGELISVANAGSTALGTSSFTYDADGRLRVLTDATGVKSYVFYDDAGRKIGTVDGDGSLTEIIYNRAHQVIKTVRYSTLLGSTTLTSLSGGTWSSVVFATLRTEANATPAANQIARNVYDASGALVYSIDELGAVTQNVYDGAGRLTDQIRFFNPQTIAASTDEVLPAAITIATNAADRRTRFFYNGDGQLTGTLDGAGYLKENVYDAAGRLTATIGYFTITNSANWLTGTLATLRPATDAARDITTRLFYDGQGRQVGQLDGENYLTENVYDVAGQVSQTIRYDRVLTYTPGTSTFATLKSAAASATTHSTAYTYDGLGQVLTETNFEGTQTLYAYDLAGNVITVTRANGVSAEARTTATRYDVLGRVTQELSGEGSVALAALGGSPTQTQIDDVWSKYGITYTYDNASRRASMSVRPNDTTTLTTYFYYDGDGRLRFELDPRGQVTEHRYNALGQVTEGIVYWRTVSIVSPTGGLLTPTLISALTGTESANVHEKTTYTYSLRGEVTATTTAAGATTSAAYNIFGELQTTNAGSGFTATDYTYDARGLLDLTKRGSTTFEDRTYDAFGRLAAVIDARGNSSTATYDRLGREITSQQPGDANARQTTYDGFSRVLTVRDKLTNTTTYGYNDSTRTVTLTTPESIVISTVHNRHGDTLTVTANGNTTTYTYDRNGSLTAASDGLGALEGRSYDRAGRQVTATDARGTITTLAYDASSRMITRTEDSASGGLQLVTTYSYDTQNRILNVTEPGGRLTRTQYDRDGRVISIIEDPNGTTPRRTDYAYDSANNTTLVTEGVGSANPRRTQYVYDALGRRTDEYVDPTSLGGTLNLRTQYRYDNNENVTRKIDAKGNSTWYVYDAQNRLTQTIDALGGVTQLTYDSEDRVTVTRRFFNTVATGSFGDAPAQQSITTSVDDHVTRTVYDRDGRQKYTLDTVSATGTNGATETAVVTERTFDAGGNVTRTRIYRTGITVPSTVSTSTVSSALTTAGNSLTTLHADDHVEWTAYDLRGRPVFTVDGTGAVVEMEYDVSGNVKASIAYATSVALSNLMTTASLTTWSDQTAVANYPRNRVTRFWYDTLDRQRFSLDGEGYLSESRYLDSANQEQVTVYAGKPTVNATDTLAQVAAAAAAAANQSLNQVTTKTFDVAGRTTQVTDANGKSEYFGYDAVGNKIKYVNQKAASASDAAYTWTYEYDAAGRLTFERSPSVTYNSVNASTLAVTPTTAQIVTRNEYDALGNVTARTEAYGTSQARITRYEYDALGRQTAAVTPTVGIYDSAGDTQWGNGSAVAVTETQTEVRSETSYDVFGNAFRNRLVTTATASNTANGAYTFKVYDNLGRVRYDIDANKQVTSYTYDVFGNKTQVTRHAAALSSTPWNTATAISAASISVTSNSAVDRTISTTFDRLGRALSVKQTSVRNFAPTVGAPGGTSYDAQPSTEYLYNAFGDVIRTSVQVNSVDFAQTYSYYDKLGRKSAELDASRYLTQFEYDETGDLTRQLEYARPTTGTVDVDTYGTIVTTTNVNAAVGTAASFAGYDRETTWTYDKLNRKTSESKRNLEYVPSTTGAYVPVFNGVQTTTYGYDVLGNQILTRAINPVDGSNIDTYTGYDVLGRVVSVAEPTRDVGTGVSRTPLTLMKRDAHGNLIQQTEYYYGASTVPTDGSAATAATPNATLDRTTTMVVDNRGNAIRTRDATDADRFASYNTRGDIAKEWQVVFNAMTSATTADDVTETIVKLYRYDAVGQTTQVLESQRYNGSSTDVVTRVAEYNAFGEITYKYNSGTVDAEKQFFDYDQAGRVWRTRGADGVVKVYMYDLAGDATLDLVSNGALDISGNNTNLDAGRTTSSAGTFTSAQSVLNGLSASTLMRTETLYDLKGNVIERRMPTFDGASVFQPAATDIQLGLNGSVTYLSWVPSIPASNLIIPQFVYRPLGSTGPYTTIYSIETLSGGRVGVNVNALFGSNYEYRITVRGANEQIPIAESNGTFRFDRTSTTNASFPTVTVDSASQVGTIGNQTGGMIVWTAPSDSTVSARMRFNGGSWITATRVSGNFQVDARTALASAGSYTWEINYLRSGTVIAAKTGALNSSGNSTGRTIAVSSTSNTTPTPYSGVIPSAVASGQNAARVLTWAINNASVTETGGLSVDVQYRRTGAGTYSGPVQATWTGSVWSWNVASLDTGVGTDNYDYIVTLRAGGRALTLQTGTFSLTDQISGNTVNLTVSSSSGLGSAPTIGAVTGTGGGNTVTWSNIISQQAYGAGMGYGNEWFEWTGPNSVRPTWTGSQDTAYVVIDYRTLSGTASSPSGNLDAFYNSAEMTGANAVGVTMTRNVQNSFPGHDYLNRYWGDIGPGGVDVIYRMRVYTSQGGTLIADSDVPLPPGRGITWAATNVDVDTTAKVYWDNGGTWTYLGDATRGGTNFSISVDSVPAGTRNMKVEYWRANDYWRGSETWAANTAIFSMTQSSGAPVLGSVSNSNHDPAVAGPVASSATDGTFRWTGAIPAGGRVTLEAYDVYNSPNTFVTLQTWTSGSSFAYDFSSMTGDPQYTYYFNYRIRYYGPSDPWPTALAVGQFITKRVITNSPGLVSVSPGNNQTYPAAVFTPTVNGSGISWNYAKEQASDRVRFRYWTDGSDGNPAELYDEDLSGTSSFNSTFPQMISQSARIYWMIEYLRPGEINSYARASGNSYINFVTTTTFASSTITSQAHAYPSTVTPIPTPTYRASDRAVLFTTAANSLSDIKFFLDGSSTSLTVTTDGSGYKVILPTLTDGSHTYNIVYQAGSANPYARVTGTFTTSTSTSSGTNFAVTVLPQRADTIQQIVPGIGTVSVPDPPYAVYHLEQQYDGSDLPIGDPIVVYGARPWGPPGTHMAGGYYAPDFSTDVVPRGTVLQLSSSQYSMPNRVAIVVQMMGDLVPVVEYWSLANPSVVKVAANSTDGGTWFADVQGSAGIANGTYGYRIRMIRDGGSMPLAGAEGTFIIGSTNSIAVSAPAAPATTATPTTKQSYDRWGNVIKVTDASNNITDYRYNGLNLLVQTLEAQDYIFDKRDAAGTKATDGILARAEKRNYYDLLGRLVETQDGYGQATRVSYDVAGNQISKRNADYARYTNGATSYSSYDIFGQLLQTKDEIGYLARFTYDKVGRLTAVWRELDMTGTNSFSNRTDGSSLATTGLLQGLRYTYDQAGRRIADTNGANETTYYRYDLLSNLTTRRSNLGSTTTYRYDADSRKTNETDAIGSTASWTYDAFRLTSHTEFSNSNANYGAGGGLVISYTYNFAGNLLTQTGGGQNVRYQYDRAGQLSVINDSSVNRKTFYTYDAAGRQSRESVVIDGRLHQDTKMAYDAHNRIKALEDPDYRQRILYDVNGNRAYLTGSVTVKDIHNSKEKYTYTYDEMNRVINSSVFFDDKMAADNTSYVYNARGDRVRQVAPQFWGHAWEVVGAGYRYRTTAPSDFAGIAEAYTYDGLGRLLTVNRNLYEKSSGTQNATDILVRSYGYDLANRQTFEQVRSVESPTSFITRSTSTGYNGDGQTTLQITTKYPQSGTSFEESRVNYGTGRSTWNSSTQTWSLGFDDANNLRAYDATTKGSSSASATTTNYTTFYNLADGYLENRQRSQVGSQWADSVRTYNVDHELTKVSYINSAGSSVDLARTRYFANNQAGQVLTVIQTPASNTTENWDRAILHTTYLNPASDPGKAQAFFFVNNNQVGAVGVVSSNEYAVPHFEVNATPISDNYPAATPATVIVQGGDTLRSVAARVFGDASLWYILADENGLTDPDTALTAGSMLRVPNDVVSLSNTADSFKPYNVADALGDTSPTVPPPPAAKGCGVIGMIIMIVVLIVATIFTAGAAAAAFGAVAASGGGLFATGLAAMGGTLVAGSAGLAAGFSLAGVAVVSAAAGAAVGSAVSQGVGIAIGNQDKFDWKQVGMAALSAGVGAGLGAAGVAAQAVAKGTQTASTLSRVGSFAGRFGSVGNAVAGSVVTQGIAVATGLQSSFSWRSVATAAISAPIADAASSFAGAATAPLGDGISSFIGNFAGNVSSGYVSKALGGKQTSQQIFADAFGNALANSFTGQATSYSGLADQPFGARISNAFENYGERNFGVLARLTKNPVTKSGPTVPSPDEQRAKAQPIMEDGSGLLSSAETTPPTVSDLTKSLGSAKATAAMQAFNEGTATVFDSNGNLILDPALESYLKGLNLSKTDVTAEKQRLMALARSGDLNAFYDFNYFSNPADSALRFDRSMTSIGDDRHAIELAMAQHGIEVNDANVALLEGKVFDNQSVSFPKELKSEFKAAAKDLRSFVRYRDQFLNGLAVDSLAITALSNFAGTQPNRTAFAAAMGDMRAAIDHGYFTLRPFTSISSPTFTAKMQQYNAGAQSEILIYKEGFSWSKKDFATGILHELVHSQRLNDTLRQLEMNKTGSNTTYFADPKTYYDTRNKALVTKIYPAGQAPVNAGPGVATAVANYENGHLFEGFVNNWYPSKILRALKLPK